MNEAETLELMVLAFLDGHRQARPGTRLSTLGSFTGAAEERLADVMKALFERGLVARDFTDKVYTILKAGREHLANLRSRRELFA